MVRFVQPHAILRRTISLVLAGAVLATVGLRNPIWFVIGTALLWIPTSMIVNMYFVYRNPVGLRAWVERGKKPFENVDVKLFDRRTR
jgi:hypothetical protein